MPSRFTCAEKLSPLFQDLRHISLKALQNLDNAFLRNVNVNVTMSKGRIFLPLSSTKLVFTIVQQQNKNVKA